MNLDYVEFKRRLKKLSTDEEIRKIIVSKIQQIPQYVDLKFDVELTLFVCKILENAVADKGMKNFDKKSVALHILQEIFNLTEDELKVISEQIEYLHSSKQIRRVSFIKIYSTAICNWAFRKFG